MKNDLPQNEKPPDTESFVHTFEDAIALTGCGKFHYRLLLCCGLCFLTVMSHTLCVSLILSLVKCDLPASLQEQGLLVSACFFGVVCCSYPMGFLGDTLGRVLTLKWSLILSSITGVLSAFSVNIWMLIITRFLTGFCAAACHVCVFSLCSEFHSDKTRARHVAIVSAFLSMSLIYLPLLAMAILPHHINFTLFGLVMTPWRILLLAHNIVPTVALVLLCFIPETPKFDLVHNNHDGALNTMRKMFTENTGRPIEEYPVRYLKMESSGSSIADIHGLKDAVKMVWSQTVPIFYRERIWHTLNISFILFMTYGISHGILMWYPTILKNEINRNGEEVCMVIGDVDVSGAKNSSSCNDQEETVTLWILEFAGIFMTITYLIFGFFIKYIGKRKILIFWQITCGFCCAAIHWISSLTLSVLVLTAIVSVSNCAGIVGAIAVEFYPTNINAMAICCVMLLGRLGAVTASNVFGLLLFNHCETMFWVLAAVSIPIIFMCWLLPEKIVKKNP